jgi:hypothetical protein
MPQVFSRELQVNPNAGGYDHVVQCPELHPDEWKVLHDVLLYPCVSGPGHHNKGAWRNAKRRVRKKLTEILRNQWIDADTRVKLSGVFEDDELNRFRILHLVKPESVRLSGLSGLPLVGIRADQHQLQQHQQQHAPESISANPPFPSETPMDVDVVAAAVPPSGQDDEPAPESAGGMFHNFISSLYFSFPLNGCRTRL